jgi:hypothetical protein
MKVRWEAIPVAPWATPGTAKAKVPAAIREFIGTYDAGGGGEALEDGRSLGQGGEFWPSGIIMTII